MKKQTEKQIEEIKDCIDNVYGSDCAYYGVDGFAIAAALYKAGYRKQSEIAREVITEICKRIDSERVISISPADSAQDLINKTAEKIYSAIVEVGNKYKAVPKS